MEILSGNYILDEIFDKPFQTVPRGVFKSRDSQFALDYHAGLLPLSLGDNVNVKLYLGHKPEINPSTYLMRGIVYKIEPNILECSFGGLLLIFHGPLSEELTLDSNIYISVAKI